MKVIQINETSTINNAIVEMLMYKEIQLYKTNKDYTIYELKHTDIYIGIVYKNNYEIEYNTQVIKNLYQSKNLSRASLLQLYNLNVFM